MARLCLNPSFERPVVCTLSSRGFHHVRGFRDFRESCSQALVSFSKFRQFLLVILVFSVVFVEIDHRAKCRFAKDRFRSTQMTSHSKLTRHPIGWLFDMLMLQDEQANISGLAPRIFHAFSFFSGEGVLRGEGGEEQFL